MSKKEVRKLLLSMADFFQGVRRSGSFAQNFAITFSGNSIAVITGFLFTPFIARIYNPEAYGQFALFSAITLNVAQLSTMQLPRGFVIPIKERDYMDLVRGTMLSVGVTILLVAAIIGTFQTTVLSALNAQSLGSFTYLIPFSVCLYAINDILKSRNIREKVFHRNAMNQVFSSVMSRGSTLAYGLTVSPNFVGLIIGDLLSKLFEVFVLAGFRIRKFATYVVSDWNWNRILSTVKSYRNYPMFVLPGIWMLSFSIQLPIYFLNKYYEISVAGYYSFANSLLNIPVTILAASISQVFLQKASESYHNDPTQMPRIVQKLTDRLYLVGLIPIGFLMVFGDWVFKYVMGEQWITSGEYARYMGMYFIFQVINFPLLTLFRIYKKEHINMITTSLLIVLNLAALFGGKMYNEPVYSIILYCVSNMLVYIINIRIVFGLVGLKFYRQLLIWLVLLVTVVSIFSGVRALLIYLIPSI